MIVTEEYKEIQNRIITSVILRNVNENIVVPAKALWDTGATMSCVSKEISEKLNLVPIGMKEIHTPSGKGIVNHYKLSMIINYLEISNFDVFGSEIGSQGIDMLIGMNIISMGDFTISNYHGKTIFNFRIPSNENIVLN